MKISRGFWAMLLALAVTLPASANVQKLNDGGALHRGNQLGAESPVFNDTEWRQLSVLHDWAVEDVPGQSDPLSKDANGETGQGYMVGGLSWYRRTIALPADVASKTVMLRFEACYLDCEIWVSGWKVVRHHYGYTAFDLDVSSRVKTGENVVAVKVNHEEPSFRGYSDSSLIRPVHLESLDKVHVDPQGPYVTTPQVSVAKASVNARTPIFNARLEPVRASLISIVVDREGSEVGQLETTQTVAPTVQQSYIQSLTRSTFWGRTVAVVRASKTRDH
jgi:beta-galactosidase